MSKSGIYSGRGWLAGCDREQFEICGHENRRGAINQAHNVNMKRTWWGLPHGKGESRQQLMRSGHLSIISHTAVCCVTP